MINNSSQTEVTILVERKIQVNVSDLPAKNTEKNLEKYDCFYCGNTIMNESKLKEYIAKCHGTHNTNFFKLSQTTFKDLQKFLGVTRASHQQGSSHSLLDLVSVIIFINVKSVAGKSEVIQK